MFKSVLFFLILINYTLGKIYPQLELFIDLNENDSIVSINQIESEKLVIELLDKNSLQSRKVKAQIPSKVLQKLKLNAEAESILWLVSDSIPKTINEVGIPERSLPDKSLKRNKSLLRKNKFKYVSYQTIFSAYTYGLSIPIALEISPEKSISLGLITMPIAFGTHYYIARNRDYHDSHLFSTNYFSSNSIALSYALSVLLIGPNENAFRAGSFSILATYPLGLWLGHKHGNRFQQEPGRVLLQSSFTYTIGAIGLAGTGLWRGIIKSSNSAIRIMVGQTMAGGIAGHYLSYLYRTNEKVPGGIGAGLGTFSIIGGLSASALTFNIDSKSTQLNSSIIMAGIGSGFMSGLWFFRDKYDNYERGQYNTLGAAAGLLTPIGIVFLFELDSDNPAGLVWMMSGGAAAGYALTRWATKNMVEKTRVSKNKNSLIKNLSFNPFPIPMPETYAGKSSVKYVFPLLTGNF